MQLLMERAFAAAGLDWRFLSLEVPAERFDDAMKGIRALGFRGVAFTTPHQVAAARSLDRLSVTAELVGAVNCAVRRDGIWLGENTDGQGFVDSLSPEFAMAGKRVLVIGAGGTARAIAVAIAQRGPAEVLILNRSADHGESLAALLKERLAVPATYVPWLGRYRVPEDIELLVHATTVGWCEPEEPVPVDLDAMPESALVADVVFNPPETRLIRDAKRRGLMTLAGIDMMANQTSLAYRFWTGHDPVSGVVHEALEEYLEI